MAELCLHGLEAVAGVAAGYTLSGLAIWAGFAACSTGVGCLAGGWLIAAGASGAAATTYGAIQIARHWRETVVPRVE
jgi:hypothetical protein